MNQEKINALKKLSETSNLAYEDEKTRLIAAGFKSQQRYEMLKDLKSAADEAHAQYSKFAKGQIHKELTKIIESDRQFKEAAARARSPWKKAKFEAGIK